jgi:hypothetical protein
MTHSAYRSARIVGVLAVVVLVSSCGGSTDMGDVADTAQVNAPILPSPADSDGVDPNSEPVNMDTIPTPAGAVPSSGPTVSGSTTLQSYDVDGMSVADLASYFEGALPSAGWATGGAPSGDGGTDWTGSWVKDGATLTITASPSELGSGPGSQFDVSVESA